VALVFSEGEKAIYECAVQLDPTSFKISENRLYITQTRLVFDLKKPRSVELSEIMDLKLESFFGEQFISLKYKDLSGINNINFVCTGFGGIISNISKTLFVYKLITRLKEGMHPRDIRLMMPGSTAELYAPWILLTLMIVTPAVSVLVPLHCPSRLLAGIILLATFIAFSHTQVYRLLLGRLRWPVCAIVSLIIMSSILVVWNNCATTEVTHSAIVYGKEVVGDQMDPNSVWHCVRIQSDAGRDSLCVTNDDWNNIKIGDKMMVYYMEGPLVSTIIPYRYDDRTPQYVLKHRI
jgi:hypothetical protein